MSDTPFLPWTWDAAIGVYKNPALSTLLRDAASARCRVAPWVKMVPGLGRRAHETVTITRVSVPSQEPTATLGENLPIPEFELSRVSLLVNEYGRATPYHSLDEDLCRFDLANPVQCRLYEQLFLIMDAAPLAAFKSTPVKLVLRDEGPIANGNYIDTITDGNLTHEPYTGLRAWLHAKIIPALNIRSIRHERCIAENELEDVVDQMESDLLVPKINGGYVCFLGHRVARTVRRMAHFEAWQLYKNPEGREIGEIGRMSFDELPHLTFIEVPNSSVLDRDEAIFFGAEAVAGVETTPFELRAALPTDYGRSKMVAVYGVAGYCLIWSSAKPGECRVLHLAQGPEDEPQGRRVWNSIKHNVRAWKQRKLSALGNRIRDLATWVDGGLDLDGENDD